MSCVSERVHAPQEMPKGRTCTLARKFTCYSGLFRYLLGTKLSETHTSSSKTLKIGILTWGFGCFSNSYVFPTPCIQRLIFTWGEGLSNYMAYSWVPLLPSLYYPP